MLAFHPATLLAISVFCLSSIVGYAQGKRLTPIYQVASGSGEQVGAFARDKFFSGGVATGTDDGVDTADVPDSPPERVYKTWRWGPNFIYTFPDLEPSKEYIVRLHFAELWYPKERVGTRVFDVLINRKQVLDGFDILKATGAKDRAIVKEFSSTADASGNIRIVFTAVKDNAACNGIEILQVNK